MIVTCRSQVEVDIVKSKFLTKAVCLFIIALTLCFSVSCTDTQTPDVGNVYYTVTFNSDGGSYVGERQVEAGKTITPPAAPTKTGYIFGGWYQVAEDGSANFKWSFDISVVTGDTTLKAKWLLPDSVFNSTPNPDGTTATITGVRGGIAGSILDIRLPEAIKGYNVTAIGADAFSELTSDDFLSITVPENITVIGDNAFYDCKVEKITVEGKIISIGENAFYNCKGLVSIKFGEGLEKIPAEAFNGCTSLGDIRLPKSLKVIEENAFDSCEAMRSVMLYSDIESIENMAFDETTIKTVYLYGTDEQITDLLENKVDFGNDSFTKAKILVYSETEPTSQSIYDGFWYIDNNGLVKLWK